MVLFSVPLIGQFIKKASILLLILRVLIIVCREFITFKGLINLLVHKQADSFILQHSRMAIIKKERSVTNIGRFTILLVIEQKHFISLSGTFRNGGRKAQYNEDAVSGHKKNHIGWFVLISNRTKDAAETLRSYRQKDAIEKGSDDLKNDLDMKRLRVHSNTSMEGRIFIQFVSLVLTTYLKGIMAEHGWTRDHNLQEIFSEMKSLREVSVEDTRKNL